MFTGYSQILLTLSHLSKKPYGIKGANSLCPGSMELRKFNLQDRVLGGYQFKTWTKNNTAELLQSAPKEPEKRNPAQNLKANPL